MLLNLNMAQEFGHQPAPPRPWFFPRLFRVKFVVDKVTFYQVPLRVLWS